MTALNTKKGRACRETIIAHSRGHWSIPWLVRLDTWGHYMSTLKCLHVGLTFLLLLVMWVCDCFPSQHKDGSEQGKNLIEKVGIFWQHLRRESGSLYIIPRCCVLGFNSKMPFLSFAFPVHQAAECCIWSYMGHS